MDKVGNTITGRDNGLSDDEYNELSDAMSPGQKLTKFKDTVMAMLSRSHSGIDSDGDGTGDAEELMKIAQGMKNKNYGLTSSVMQDDENIPLSKKIPSGLS